MDSNGHWIAPVGSYLSGRAYKIISRQSFLNMRNAPPSTHSCKCFPVASPLAPLSHGLAKPWISGGGPAKEYPEKKTTNKCQNVCHAVFGERDVAASPAMPKSCPEQTENRTTLVRSQTPAGFPSQTEQRNHVLERTLHTLRMQRLGALGLWPRMPPPHA